MFILPMPVVILMMCCLLLAGNNEGTHTTVIHPCGKHYPLQIIKLRNLSNWSLITRTNRLILGRQTFLRVISTSEFYPRLRIGCLTYTTIVVPLIRAGIISGLRRKSNKQCSGYGKVTTDRTVGCVCHAPSGLKQVVDVWDV